MRLIGLLVTLAVIGYTTYIYLGSSNTTLSNGIQTKPAEYIDQTNQSVDAINDALQKQKDKLDNAN
jgi:hypothetical protein